MLPNETEMVIVCCHKPPKGLKTQKGRFSCKIALRLKKVCYKVSLCENYQQHSCEAFTGLTIRAEMIGGDVLFYAKIWWMMTHPAPIFLSLNT